MGKKIKCLVRDKSGATAMEYGLIVAGIAVAIIVVTGTLGGKVSGTFSTISGLL